jgi:hypothetical protein
VGWMQYEVTPHKEDPADPIKFPQIDKTVVDTILEKSSSLLKK